MLGIPVIHTKHGRAVSSFSRVPGLRRWIYNLAEIIAVVSRDTGNNFIRRTGVDPGKVVTVYNGIDMRRFGKNGGRAVREEFGIGESQILFGTVSRLSPEKDHANLISAFSMVASGDEDCRLLIVGDGPARGELERMAENLVPGGKVIFAGFREDTAACLSAIDLFIQPSLEEGLSLTILEAAASGTPIVTTPVGGTPEILTAGAEAVMVQPGNNGELASAMEEFLEDRERFELMAGEAAREVRERFSLSGMENNYRELYRRVTGSERR
jgi:glycosyltransferase involved in cell wall biosynthesis